MNSKPSSNPPRILLLSAFVAIYVIWGSTYLAIRVAVETLPPFLMAACRFLVAGSLLMVWLRIAGAPWPAAQTWRNAAIVGTLLLVGGNGLVVWAEQSVTSSLTALLIALAPVWFALLEWVRPGGSAPGLKTSVGILVGFAGVMLLLSGENVNGTATVPPLGIAAILVAGMCWAAGSLVSKHCSRVESPWMNAAAQMVCGGAGLLLIGSILGEWPEVQFGRFSSNSLWALAYLIVVGSWIGFSAYVWLLKVSTPARVSTYAYVNPVIAVFLGWVWLDEPVGARVFWAALVIVLGVAIITMPGWGRGRGNGQ
jgi:drug/metabolite transporter (DMT)-like permease